MIAPRDKWRPKVRIQTLREAEGEGMVPTLFVGFLVALGWSFRPLASWIGFQTQLF